MKSERRVTALLAAVLASLLSLGAVGCVVTAFDLSLKSALAVALVCVGAAVFCAGAFSWKHGGMAVLLLGALLAGYLWRQGEAAEQVRQLISRISHVYDQAYDWGVLSLTDAPWDAGFADLPMGILGAVIALSGAWTVCRGENTLFAIVPALLPLYACLVVTDTVPDAQCLFLLIYAFLLLILTGRVRSGNPSQGNRLTLLAAVPTALALGLLFLTVPQEGYVNQSEELRDSILSWIEELPETVENTVQGAASNAQSSQPERVNLASLGRRMESTAPVMEVTAEAGGTLYLRGQDYDSYDGTGWTATRNRVEEFSCRGIDLGTVTIRTRNKMDQLYLPYYPENGQSLVGGKLDNTRLSTEYSFLRTGLPDDWQTQLAADAGSPEFPVAGVGGPYLNLQDTKTFVHSGEFALPNPAVRDPDQSEGSVGGTFPERNDHGESTSHCLLRAELSQVRQKYFPNAKRGTGFCPVVSGKGRYRLLRPLCHGGCGAAAGGRNRSPVCQRLYGKGPGRGNRHDHRGERPRLGGVLRAWFRHLDDPGSHPGGHQRTEHPARGGAGAYRCANRSSPGTHRSAAQALRRNGACAGACCGKETGACLAGNTGENPSSSGSCGGAPGGPAIFPDSSSPPASAERHHKRPGPGPLAGGGAAGKAAENTAAQRAGSPGAKGQVQPAHPDGGGTGQL